MPRITRRPQSVQDILDIWDHIAEDNLLAADRWIDGFDQALELWATQLRMGRSRDELSAGLRSFSYGRYVAFYEPLPDGLDLVRVLHGSRDIEAQFMDQS